MLKDTKGRQSAKPRRGKPRGQTAWFRTQLNFKKEKGDEGENYERNLRDKSTDTMYGLFVDPDSNKQTV